MYNIDEMSFIAQTRYMNNSNLQCIFFSPRGVLGPHYHFRVTICHTDLSKFCTTAQLVIEIKIKKYKQWCHIYFENYLLN